MLKASPSTGTKKGRSMLGNSIFSTLGEDIKYPNLFSRWAFIWLQESVAMFKEQKSGFIPQLRTIMPNTIAVVF